MLGRDSQARPTSATSAAQGPGGPRTARPAWRCPGYRFGPCCADQTAAPEWIAKYREGGLAAISAKIASGRPTALDDSEMIRLHAMISGKDPRTQGFGMALWSRALIRDMIKRACSAGARRSCGDSSGTRS